MLWHILDRNLTAKGAIREPRLHERLTSNEMLIEWTFDNAMVGYSSGKEHNGAFMRPGHATKQAVRGSWDRGFEAAADTLD